MEQGGDGRRGGGEGGEMNKQPRDRGQKEIMQVDQPAQPQQPQKCPRCDSYNTKFCYYNNYSLSQPRYFCKTCRRYWTQGGTLRNVPVGGGCRKGKRAKNSSSSSVSTSSSSENQNSSLPPPPPPPQLQHTQARAIDPSSIIVANSPSLAPFYQGVGVGGFLSSLASMNQLNPPPHPFDHQSLNIGGGSSNLGLLHGFNVAPFGSQRQIVNRPSQFYQVGTAGSGGRDNQVLSLYSTSSEQGLIPSSMANANTNAAAATHRDWPQGFINSAASNRASDDASLWSTINTTSIGAANSDRNGAAAAGSASDLVPNQWPHLPRFDPPS